MIDPLPAPFPWLLAGGESAVSIEEVKAGLGIEGLACDELIGAGIALLPFTLPKMPVGALSKGQRWAVPWGGKASEFMRTARSFGRVVAVSRVYEADGFTWRDITLGPDPDYLPAALAAVRRWAVRQPEILEAMRQAA